MNAMDRMRERLANQNPFAVQNKDGRLVWYHDAREAYQLILQDLWSQFPAGFVDVRLFMMQRQGLSSDKCCDICPEKQYAYIHWWDLQNPDVQFKLKYVLRLLLTPWGFSLDEPLFEGAVNLLDYTLSNTGVKDKLKQICNLHVIQTV